MASSVSSARTIWPGAESKEVTWPASSARSSAPRCRPASIARHASAESWQVKALVEPRRSLGPGKGRDHKRGFGGGGGAPW